MARVKFDLPTSTAPTASLVFHESLVSITRKHPMPIQQVEIAISGTEYVRTLHANVEEMWEIDFRYLHEGVDSSLSGFSALKAFIQSSSTGASYSKNTFEVTDADGDALTGRYIRGLESFREAGLDQDGKAGRFFGTIQFRKTL